MKREETIRVLNGILQKKEKDVAELQASIQGLKIAIREVEMAIDSVATTPQRGTFREALTDAMVEILAECGPLHRNDIAEKIRERGLHVGGGVRTIGSYLSVEERFRNVGKGIWGLRPEETNEETNHSNGHDDNAPPIEDYSPYQLMPPSIG